MRARGTGPTTFDRSLAVWSWLFNVLPAGPGSKLAFITFRRRKQTNIPMPTQGRCWPLADLQSTFSASSLLLYLDSNAVLCCSAAAAAPQADDERVKPPGREIAQQYQRRAKPTSAQPSQLLMRAIPPLKASVLTRSAGPDQDRQRATEQPTNWTTNGPCSALKTQGELNAARFRLLVIAEDYRQLKIR